MGSVVIETGEMESIYTSFILRLADVLLALHNAGLGCVGHADFM